MESINDNVEGGVNFKWTDEYDRIFSQLCINFLSKNGRVPFKWKEINDQFQVNIKRKCKQSSLKNKYDFMKKEWRLWKFLKFGESNVGWDPITGKLNCSNEWWERKIKEEPRAGKFRNKPVDPSLEKLWRQLFEENYPKDENVVGQFIDPNYVQQRQQVNANIVKKDNESGDESNANRAYAEYNQYASHIGNLTNEEHIYFSNFVQDLGYINMPTQGVGGTQVSNEGGYISIPTQTPKITNKPMKGKRKRRQSGEATKLSCQIDNLVSKSNMEIEISKSEGSVSKKTSASSTIEAAMVVINRMVDQCILEENSELWCFAVCLIENKSRRRIFLNIGNDGSRTTWLKYMHSKEK